VDRYGCQQYDITRLCRFDRRALDSRCDGCQRVTDKDYLSLMGLWVKGVSHKGESIENTGDKKMKSLKFDSDLEFSICFIVSELALPAEHLECIILVDFDDDSPAFFYGKRVGEKWYGVMPWDKCECCECDESVSMTEIYGRVLAWAHFPNYYLQKK